VASVDITPQYPLSRAPAQPRGRARRGAGV